MLHTLSSDPRVWMGGRIPTPWRWYGWENRDDRENRLRRQIGCSSLCNLGQKSLCFDTFSKKHKQRVAFKAAFLHSKRLPAYLFLEFMRSQNCGPRERGLGRVAE